MDGCTTCLGEVDASLVDKVVHPHPWDKHEASHVRPPPARRLLQSSVDHRTQAASHILHVDLLPARPSVGRSVGISVQCGSFGQRPIRQVRQFGHTPKAHKNNGHAENIQHKTQAIWAQIHKLLTHRKTWTTNKKIITPKKKKLRTQEIQITDTSVSHIRQTQKKRDSKTKSWTHYCNQKSWTHYTKIMVTHKQKSRGTRNKVREYTNKKHATHNQKETQHNRNQNQRTHTNYSRLCLELPQLGAALAAEIRFHVLDSVAVHVH